MTETRYAKVCGGLSALLIAAALLIGAPAAMAQLPGGSAVDEYTENVPGAGGDQPGGHSDGQANNSSSGASNDAASSGADSGPTGAGATSVSPDSLSEDAASGSAISGQSSPVTSVGGSNASATQGSHGHGPPTVPATLTSQPVPVAATSQQSQGISAAWPIAIAAVVLASVGIYWYRRRYPEALVERRPQRVPQRLVS